MAQPATTAYRIAHMLKGNNMSLIIRDDIDTSVPYRDYGVMVMYGSETLEDLEKKVLSRITENNDIDRLIKACKEVGVPFTDQRTA